MGSGREEHAELSEPLGRLLAERGVHLLTGGGAGVMSSVSRAFAETRPRDGLVLGIVPGHCAEPGGRPEPPDGYPNPWIEVVIRTHLPWSGEQGADPRSRNHINVLSSDLVVALPGGAGTRSEIELARRYEVPVIAFGERAVPVQGVELLDSLDAFGMRLAELLRRRPPHARTD